MNLDKKGELVQSLAKWRDEVLEAEIYESMSEGERILLAYALVTTALALDPYCLDLTLKENAEREFRADNEEISFRTGHTDA